MTPTTHTLHSGHTFTTHYALCYALLPISLALQFTTEYLHCNCHWGWTEIIWRETSMCFFVFCLLRLTLQRRKSCSSVVDHLCSLVLYFFLCKSTYTNKRPSPICYLKWQIETFDRSQLIHVDLCKNIFEIWCLFNMTESNDKIKSKKQMNLIEIQCC